MRANSDVVWLNCFVFFVTFSHELYEKCQSLTYIERGSPKAMLSPLLCFLVYTYLINVTNLKNVCLYLFIYIHFKGNKKLRSIWTLVETDIDESQN